MTSKRILSVTVANKPGVLSRITGLFSRRNYNINSLNVGETENPEYSRMTIVVDADDRTLEQIKSQLDKLVEVIQITELDRTNIVDRDLALIRVNSSRNQRSEIIQIVDTFRARIVDLSTDTIMIEATGTPSKIEALIEILKDFGIIDIVRTGLVALNRGVVE
ncbi:MAG: acetolactate synthase small subunit [Halanaerobiaceae bacterium]|mgnify:CR=1 FL=1|nr:acetolactate synthase small subunit [Halanaerobiaceae bacterium]